MSGIWEVYLWRVTGKNIRNNSGNCHIVGMKKWIIGTCHWVFQQSTTSLVLSYSAVVRSPRYESYWNTETANRWCILSFSDREYSDWSSNCTPVNDRWRFSTHSTDITVYLSPRTIHSWVRDKNLVKNHFNFCIRSHNKKTLKSV